MKKKILLIGCGKYAQKYHIPVLLENQRNGKIEVSAVLVDYLHVGDTQQELRRIGLRTQVSGVEYNIGHDNIAPILDKTARTVRELINKYEPHGAIVTPIPVFNYEITKVCLEKNLHVLVEKPATCPPNCCWDEQAASKIFPQLDDLVSLAEQNGLRLLVGAQRRYERIYKWVAHKCGPLEVVQAVHACGWGQEGAQIPMNDYKRWRRYPYLTGGKIMLSGYHVLDIVTWWIRKAFGIEAEHARVFSSFDRHDFQRFMQNGTNNNTEKTASIQIQFFKDNEYRKPTCLASFLFTTAGPKDWTRETYFVTNSVQDRFTIERDHSRDVDMLPTISKRTDGQVNDETIVIPGAAGGNEEPTKDFIYGLLNGQPLYGQEVSSGKDHLNSAQLIQAIYLSAIQGNPQCVTLQF